ncbi:xylitol dehydrogenase [Ceraceosorus bombacis]|uniref:Xylitol dehydrogenase n=1 Tax=Ceraceosorus bombacis TaxID=401625 RepID=A0A0N7LB31_9BASI|nr:xylitol dehydrogenase [Ceraceosorus bombacis]
MSDAKPIPHTNGTIGHDNSIPVPPVKGNKSFVLQAVDKTVFEERPIPTLKPHQVQVNVRQTGICGSDVHYWKHGRIGDFVLTSPMVLGHESAGIVTAVGSHVKSHKVGDRVALEPGVPCFTCDTDKAGHYNFCRDLEFAATPPYDGTLATYYNLHASFAHKVPDNLTLEEASLMEPLGVAVQAAVRQGQVRALQNVIVFGAGPIGLLTGAVAKAYGAKRVILVDIVPSKLEFAKSFCATDTFIPTRPAEGETAMEAAERNALALKGQMGVDVIDADGADLVLECTGAPPCVQMGLFMTRAKGRFVQVGMGSPDVLLPLHRINMKELEVTGSFRYGSGVYRTAIDLVSQGLVDVKRIVTHRYTFDDAIQAFAATAAGKGEDGKTCIKVQICQGQAQ